MPDKILLNFTEFLSFNKLPAFGVNIHTQHIVFWNWGVQNFLGYLPSEVLGKKCYEIFCGISTDFKCENDCKYVVLSRINNQSGANDTLFVKNKQGALIRTTVMHLLIPAVDSNDQILLHIISENSKTSNSDIQSTLNQFNALFNETDTGTVKEIPLHSGLTPREKEIVVLLGQGITTEDICDELSISYTTVRNHIQNLLSKTGTNNRLQAVSYAYRNQLI